MENRKEMIRAILTKRVKEKDIVVTSNGMTARNAYAVFDRPLNLYLTGAMGSGLAVAIGLAMNLPDRTVHLITGDAAYAMGYSATLLPQPKNLKVWVLVNGVCATTGGQPCPKVKGFHIENHDLSDVSPRVGITLGDNVNRLMLALGVEFRAC